MLLSLNGVFGHCIACSHWDDMDAYTACGDVIQACLRVYEVTCNHEACEVRGL